MTIDTEIEQNGGNKEEKMGKGDENKRNANSGMFIGDIKGVTTDTEKEQT